MTKVIHHIFTPNSGALDSFCVESWKKIYPEWEIKEWIIEKFDDGFNFEILRILYENGGLFIGNNVQAIKKIPQLYFKKPFVSFDNSFESNTPNPRICAYCEKGDESIKKILDNKRFPEINSNGEEDIEINGINYLNRMEFGMYDKEAGELYSDGYLLYIDSMSDKFNEYNVVCYVFEKDTNLLFDVIRDFSNNKKESKKDFLLLSFNKLNKKNVDIANKCALWLNYNCINNIKIWNIVYTDKGGKDLITEYIGKNFDNLISYKEIVG